EIDAVLEQVVEYRLQHKTRDFLTALDRVRAFHQHFRLHDRNDVRFLGQSGVTGQRLRVGFDGESGWNSVGDVDHRTPLRETRSELVILSEALTQPVQPFRDRLTLEAGERLG